MSRLSREEGDQEMETASERMITVKMVSEDQDIEMSPLTGEEGNQERETETANEGRDNDHDQEKNINDYLESLKDNFFFKSLQNQKENFLKLPASDENVHPLTFKKRTKTHMIIALALFFMR